MILIRFLSIEFQHGKRYPQQYTYFMSQSKWRITISNKSYPPYKYIYRLSQVTVRCAGTAYCTNSHGLIKLFVCGYSGHYFLYCCAQLFIFQFFTVNFISTSYLFYCPFFSMTKLSYDGCYTYDTLRVEYKRDHRTTLVPGSVRVQFSLVDEIYIGVVIERLTASAKVTTVLGSSQYPRTQWNLRGGR